MFGIHLCRIRAFKWSKLPDNLNFELIKANTLHPNRPIAVQVMVLRYVQEYILFGLWLELIFVTLAAHMKQKMYVGCANQIVKCRMVKFSNTRYSNI